MKTKQLIAIIIACVLVLLTGISGVISATILNSINQKNSEKAQDIINSFTSPSNKNEITTPDSDYIGQLNIVGTIQESSSTPALTEGEQYNHNMNISFVDKMISDDKNKGIFLYVDSPGGTVYHSDEMYLKLMEYKEKTGRPIYAYFGSYACSGAYYISMAADQIFANRNTWTGSIGVIISMYNYKNLLDKIGVSQIDIISGNNKNIGSGAVEMTDEQKEIFQSLVDDAFDQFVDIVVSGRNLSESKVREIADGRIYDAKQALANKMVDKILSYDETKAEVKSLTGCDNIYSQKTKKSIYSLIYGISNLKNSSTDSDIKAAMEMMENDNNGVLMYYAK